jgi:hypothetical protein
MNATVKSPGAIMSEETTKTSWFQSLPGILTAVAAVLTAVTGLVLAWSGLISKNSSSPSTASAQDCIPGYVWRLATPEDHVCVTRETHLQTLQDNELSGSRRENGVGPYGADTCKVGFVWRDSFNGDHVCVTPQTRKQVALDNQQAPVRIKH